MFDLQKIIRENVKKLTPYSSARDEYQGTEGIFLDANENPFDTGLNRYPDPYQSALKEKISGIKNLPAAKIFLGNGSDEIIDLLIRAFCEPLLDSILIVPPTYGMYSVAASINNVPVKQCLLDENFGLQAQKMLKTAKENTKLIFLCSPNNPTGGQVENSQLEILLQGTQAIVVVDEAYIDFSEKPGALALLEKYPNLLVMQTFSKAWGLAALRVGMGFAAPEIVAVLNKIKPPYNVNTMSQRVVMQAIEKQEQYSAWVKAITEQRKVVEQVLTTLPIVEKVYPSDANFLLVKVKDAKEVYQKLAQDKIVVRDRSNVPLCKNCLRISIGTMEQNLKLLEKLKNMK